MRIASTLGLCSFLAACAVSEPPAPAVAQARETLRVQARDDLVVGFWNVENLFDTADDPDNAGDDEYLPSEGWTDEIYQIKLDHLADVIAAVNPHVLGLAEVENRAVLEALVAHPRLASLGLQIVHLDSGDSRGIDVALLFREPVELTDPDAVTLHDYRLEGSRPSRGILQVPLAIDGEALTVLVNHWPSRGGDRDGSFRAVAGQQARAIVDDRLEVDPGAAILVVGDFNDDPFDPSVREALRAVRSRNAVVNRENLSQLWNTSWSLLGEPDLGTLYYNRDWVWNVFDQIHVSKGLLDGEGLQWIDDSLSVYAPDTLRDQYRRPLRFRKGRGDEWNTGYSDHFLTFGRVSRVGG